jgi:hypothetical protein
MGLFLGRRSMLQLLLLVLPLATMGQDDNVTNESTSTNASCPKQGSAYEAELPSTSAVLLRFESGPPYNETQQAHPGTGGGSIQLFAGQSIDSMSLLLTGQGDYFNVSAARLKFVLSSVSSAMADAGACSAESTALGGSEVNQPFAGQLGAPTTLTECDSVMGATSLGGDGIQFRMGGSFKVCYSDVGTFDGAAHVDLLDVTIHVWGIYDDCSTADCLATQTYRCYARKDVENVEGSCALSFNGTGKGVYPSDTYTWNGTGKLTWSALWVPTYDAATGALVSQIKSACGTSPDYSVMCFQASGQSHCFAQGTAELNGTTSYLTADNGVAALTMHLSASNMGGYAVAACYCPSYGGCDEDTDFTQQIGVVQIFSAKLCDPWAGTAACVSGAGFYGVAAKTSFSVMVHCPPGGCPPDESSRVRLVDQNSENDKLFSDPGNG